MRAVILAGGKGTRLQPFTASFPKPLVPLGDTPVVEVLIRRLVRCGVRDVTLTVGHLAELIKSYFDHRRSLAREIKLSFVEEEEPLGTAGSLALVPGLTETFLAMNGDLLTDLDFRKLARFHREQGALLTIATHAREVKIDLGVMEFGADFQLTGYREKPRQTFHVSMGVYVYEPEVLRYIEPHRYLDFPDLVLRLLDAGERVRAYLNDGLWLDIGNPEDYARAQELFAARREAFEQ
ncbi:MAG: NTP transferase domain-containing protein [Acidobacteria bacterium]|nr:NTP transferase domain-containing protein [Acidobacteriota bacterium]